MKRVSVIATVHRDTGLANAAALLAILERLHPEAIFLEQPEAAFREFLSGTHSGLEPTAVNRYRQMHHVELLPVDLPTPPFPSRADIDYLFDAIESQSPDYRRFSEAQSAYTSAYGFDFLNSGYCTKLWSLVQEAERSAVQALGDDRLAELYQSWRRIIELRDRAMIKNIQTYCQYKSFAEGVFLVGSAHRQSIYDKSRESSESGSAAIHWAFPGLKDDGSDE